MGVIGDNTWLTSSSRFSLCGLMIPFAKTIENFLAALPTQAALEVKIRELAAKITVLEKENAELNSQLEILRPKHDLSVETGKLLKHMFELNQCGLPDRCLRIVWVEEQRGGLSF